MSLIHHARRLDRLYRLYNSLDYLSPDPLELVRRYRDDDDREVAGLVAASLAYGRVKQINRNVEAVLGRLGDHPARRLEELGEGQLPGLMLGIRHRFASAAQIAGLLLAAARIRREFGSLGGCFGECWATTGQAQPALGRFVGRLKAAAGVDLGHLLAEPSRGSACKRLWLYLRWMVRRDEVDLGCWRGAGLTPAMLLVPLDVHMHRICRHLGATNRPQPDWRAAAEATQAFAGIRPDDPVRYDFVLTRLGIHPELRRLGLAGLQ